MIKISKTQLLPYTKNAEKKSTNPKYINVIRLAQFSGVEVFEKTKGNLSNEQNIFSLSQLQQKLKEIKEKFKQIISNSFSNITSSGSLLFLDLNKKNMTQNVLSQLRNERLLHKEYLRKISELIMNEVKIPHIDKLCNDVPTKQFFAFLDEPMIISQKLLVHHITGEDTVTHFNNVQKNKKLYSSCSVETLFNMKKKILTEFKEYTNTDSLIPDYKFSKANVKRLKLLTAKYEAIDDLLSKNYGIHTPAIEALFYSGIEKCSQAGDILPNKDVMLGFSSVYDKSLKKNIPTILSFANTDMGYRFKSYKYDEDLILNIEKYKKQLMYSIKTKNYKFINDLENRIYKYLKNIEIAEVYIEPKDAIGLEKEMQRCPDMTSEKIETVLKDKENDIFYYIKALKNYDTKRYYNASLPLIKLVKEFIKINSLEGVYTEALAYNNVKHSPVGLYIRYGCEPISMAKDEVLKSLSLKEGFDYKRSVWLRYKM